MKVGVLDVQGDVSEHISSLENAVSSLGLKARVCGIKDPGLMRSLSALVIPGGESTTVGMLVKKYGMDDAIRQIAGDGVPILGTCAGLVLLAKEGNSQVLKTGQPLLSLMDVKVSRNAFGRQRESFEAELDIPVLGERPYHGVFIRAPAIEMVWGGANALSFYDSKIVMARQDNMLAVSFHPELTGDLRLHEYFLEMM
ncbi:MAG: pyridoxal 5'-phosphate synthase glutaminase subunit PdxT [Candidatus Altiarchaeota archaeon]